MALPDTEHWPEDYLARQREIRFRTNCLAEALRMTGTLKQPIVGQVAEHGGKDIVEQLTERIGALRPAVLLEFRFQ